MVGQVHRFKPAQRDDKRDRQKDEGVVDQPVRRRVTVNDFMGQGGMQRQRQGKQWNDQKHRQSVTKGDEDEP